MEYLTDYGKEVIDYYNSEYKKQIDIDRLAPKLSTLLQPYYSSRKRFTSNIQKLKYSFLFKKTNMICTAFIIGRGELSTNYAYLYSEVDAANPKKYEHKYASLSSTFKSQDGEYRYRFNQLVNIEAAKEQILGEDAYNRIEEHMLKKLEKGKITLRAQFYYPKIFIGDFKIFEEDINSGRYAIKFLSLLWLADFNDIFNHQMQNHMIEKYQKIMYNPAEDTILYEQVKKVIGAAEIEFFCDVLKKVVPDISLYRRYREKCTSVNYLSTGQKIFPIAQKEVYSIGNIMYPVWREIYISGLCSNLVANFICPCFPVTNDWFFIQNITLDMFDNEAQHEKFNNSKIAKEIGLNLAEVKKQTFIKKTTQPINFKFKKLSDKISSSISYTENHLILSDLALCLQMEHAGRTIKDVFQITAENVKAENPQREKFAFLTNIKICRKIIFDYIYGFYCLNSRLSIAHGDLHLNNGTIYKLYEFELEKNIPVPGPKSLYFINEKEAYLLDHDGSFGIIIDLSRGVVANRSSLRETFGLAFTETFIKDQNDRILRVLFRYFGEFVAKFKDQLLAKLLDSPDLFFKIFSVIDTFALAKNLSTLLEIEQSNIKVTGEITQFLSKLSSAAELKIISNLEKMIGGTIAKIEDVEWPNLELIRLFYEENLLDFNKDYDKKTTTICDVFNAAAPMKADMKDYKTWPNILKFDNEYDILMSKKHPTPQAKNFEEWKERIGYDESNMINVLKDKYRPEDYNKSPVDWLMSSAGDI